MNIKQIKAAGYYCVLDQKKPSISIFSKTGFLLYSIEGYNRVEPLLDKFADSLDPNDKVSTFEDWMLLKYFNS